jgi:hypothetical protein
MCFLRLWKENEAANIHIRHILATAIITSDVKYPSLPVLATSDIRSNIRNETASKKLSRDLLHVEMTRKRNALRHQ